MALDLVALTISPPTSYLTPSFNYNDEITYLVKTIKRFSKHYIIYPELDDSARLHYHAIMQITDNIKYYKSGMTSLRKLPRQVTNYNTVKQAFICVKPIKTFIDHLKWLMYIRKNWQITSEVLGILEPVYPKVKTKLKKKQFGLYQKTIYSFFPRTE